MYALSQETVHSQTYNSGLDVMANHSLLRISFAPGNAIDTLWTPNTNVIIFRQFFYTVSLAYFLGLRYELFYTSSFQITLTYLKVPQLCVHVKKISSKNYTHRYLRALFYKISYAHDFKMFCYMKNQNIIIT